MSPSSVLLRAVRSTFSSFTGVMCFATLLSLGTTPAWAQATSNATVAGQVKDQQGASVPGQR